VTREMTPKMLDWIVSGVPVRIYHRPSDGVYYASVHDFELFGVKPVETIRVRATPTLPADINTWPKVIAALKKWNGSAPHMNWRPGLPVIAGFRFDRFPLNVATRPIRASDWLVVPLFIVGFIALLWMDRRGIWQRIRETK
jgi:hypothetical protein